VEAWCARHGDQGFKFAHLDDWPGYKSGALNYVLRQLTAADADVIGIIDSDYQVQPGWLRRCAPAFADPWIGFVQTPQDYRGWQDARYYLVDDAIVMIENCFRNLEKGMTPMQAALEGARQIGFTVISISISLVAAFIPLLFMSGVVGRVFREFSVTLAFAIAVSTLVSLTVTP